MGESDGRKVPIGWGGKWVPIPQALPIRWISLHFLMLWEIDWGNPSISHIIKYTIGCESNGIKAPMFWEKYEHQFTRFSTSDGFCRIFPRTNFPGFYHLMGFPAFSHAMGNWWQNPCISYMMKYTTWWKSNGKNRPLYGTSMGTNFPGLSHSMGFTDFPNTMGNLIRKPMHFSCDEVCHRKGI